MMNRFPYVIAGAKVDLNGTAAEESVCDKRIGLKSRTAVVGTFHRCRKSILDALYRLWISRRK